MNFAQFLLILKARRMIFLIVLTLTIATTLVVNLILPKSYKAVASLVLNSKGMDPVTGLTMLSLRRGMDRGGSALMRKLPPSRISWILRNRNS